MRRRARLRIGIEVTITILIAALGVALWPSALGGSTTIIIVHGNSMQGSLDSGDLAIVRGADRYHVGDIVAYHVPKGQVAAGRVVIHRIVGVNAVGFEMRGDNRSTNDAWFPAASDIVGRVVAHVPIPAGERFWGVLPWVFGALIGGGVIWLLWSRTGVPVSNEHAADDRELPDEDTWWSVLRWREDVPENWDPPVPVPVAIDAALVDELALFAAEMARDLDELSCSVGSGTSDRSLAGRRP